MTSITHTRSLLPVPAPLHTPTQKIWSQGIATNVPPPWCVWLTDFGSHDGAVSEILGVMYTLNPEARVAHISHNITPFAITEAAWRLYQAFHYWPAGTHFIGVVDPDVGTDQASLWAQSHSDHIFLAPNNGLLSVIDQNVGWRAVRSIDRHRHMASYQAGHTSYGRDLYAYVAARLTAGIIQPSDLGPDWTEPLATLPHRAPCWRPGGVQGTGILFDRYGNLWSDISLQDPHSQVFQPERSFHITITHKETMVLNQRITFHHTYAHVAKGQWVMYGNSMDYVALAICCGDARETLALSLDHLTIDIQWDERK